MQLVEIFKNYDHYIGKEVEVNGWVKTCRKQKEPMFIDLVDGTTQKPLQIIVSSKEVLNLDEVKTITTGTSLNVKGLLVTSPAKGQYFELAARAVKIYQICAEDFPIQKTGLTLDFLRGLPHLRHRTNLLRAVFKVKSTIVQTINEFFIGKNYTYVDLPAITTNACEGGCQPLLVTSLLNEGKASKLPVKQIEMPARMPDEESRSVTTDDIDFTKDFFRNQVYLTVSNQLHLEAFSHGLGYVYTITQATRGEPSQTTKHLAHFNMLEAEHCFTELKDNIDLVESLIRYCTWKVQTDCPKEMEMLDITSGNKLFDKLNNIIHKPFTRIDHFDAIKILKEAHANQQFTNEPQFDGDLSGEHERYLVKHFGNPVAVMYYPKAVKAFYMPVHHSVEIDNTTIEYVDCFDLLMDIGEVVGGSQRIWKENELVDRMQQNGIDPKHLQWYVDLRKYGSVPHGGFGLGIERLTATITGMENVKDCISFPITVGHCTY